MEQTPPFTFIAPDTGFHLASLQAVNSVSEFKKVLEQGLIYIGGSHMNVVNVLFIESFLSLS